MGIAWLRVVMRTLDTLTAGKCAQRLDTSTDCSVFELEMPPANISVSPFRAHTGLYAPETSTKSTVD